MMISPWDKGTVLFERALDVRSGIHETIASNIANEETPGYKAKHLPFPETFAAALRGDGPLNSMATHSRHFGAHSGGGNFQSIEQKDVGAGIDENTVSLEKEMTLMAENTILYMAVSQFLDGRFEGWKKAIAEGR